MITVQQAIELLQKCNPDAIIRFAIVEEDYSQTVAFIEECDIMEVHFCDSKPEKRPTFEDYLTDESDFWVEVISETNNFAQIKTHAAAPLAD